MAGMIRAGIGGWNFEPWRGVFYPDGLRQADELNYAASKLTAIEINSTYYSSQKPETFAKWAASVPDGFVFAVKASRFSTNRRILAEAGESVGKFLGQGIVELGDRLGPVIWQFAPTKQFDPDDLEGGLALRHVLEVRHPTFACPEFVALARKYDAVICLAEHATYPMIADVTGPLVYARLMKGSDDIETAYPADQLDAWADRFKVYAAGGAPADLTFADAAHPAPVAPRDVFAFVIHEGKVRAPAAAQELIRRFANGG
jgi:uncharacterized protein YecE (DUF72 family)